MTGQRAVAREWALRLFRRSVLKQAKWKALRDATDEFHDGKALDLGSDNGVVSLLFRERGGRWRSADLDPQAVESIRALVGDPVEKLEGPALPYGDASFDLVVVVDLMEHIHDDRALARELARVLRPGGRVVINVPRLTRRSPLRALRLKLGLTDEKHGHVRPGYSKDTLGALLSEGFEEFGFRTYVGPCSALVDIALSWAFERKRGGQSSSKGAMVTSTDEERLQKSLRLYGAVYPFVKLFSFFDLLFCWLPGHMLLATARRKS